MDPIYFNAAMLPFFATMLIPEAIRNRETGEYLGFINARILFYFLIILLFESFTLINKFGLSVESLLRIILITAMPFVGGYLFVKYSHKQLFGVEFNPHNKKGS